MSAPLAANALACVEQEIACAVEKARQHLVFLSNLRAKRNSLLPVYRLPPETLAIIFVHGARDYYENDPTSRTSCIPSWVNVSYVCTHWRDTALNCPALWTYHFNLSLCWTEELLLRSKQASLKISCTYPDQSPGYWSPPNPYQWSPRHWWSSNLASLLQHSERVQELRLCLPVQFIPSELSLCIPRLENLEIQLHHRSDGWSLAIIGDTPVLRKLKLVCCPLPWYSLSLRRLNTLYLDHTLVQSDMGMFLALLRGMQDLSILQLNYALPSARSFLSGGGLGTSPKIDLPRLTFLAVIAPISTVVALLFCVNIPLKTRLSLRPLYENSSSVHDYAPISSFLSQHFGTPQQQASSGSIFRSLTINADLIPSLTFSSLERDYHPPSQTEESGHNIPLEITLGDYEELDGVEEMTWSDKHHIMINICSSLLLTHLQSLHVIEPFQFSADLWEEILGHLDGLRYMKLSYGSMPDLSALFIAAFKPKESPGGGSAPPTSHIFIPALEELELHHIVFEEDTTQQHLIMPMSQKSLFDALSTREGLRDRVKMTGCSAGLQRMDL